MDRLIVDAKYSMSDNLPLASVAQIRALDGVAGVAQMNWFGAYYQDPKNGFAQYVVDPAAFFDVYRELIVEPDVLKQFAATRIGVVASTSLAQKYGWHPGDAIPLHGLLWPKQDGSWDWQFQLVGTFAYPKGAPDQPLLLLHYDYFNEAVAGSARNQVGWLIVADHLAGLDDRREGDRRDVRQLVRRDLDRHRKGVRPGVAAQFGNIALIVLLVSAVFVTIVLIIGNTMLQSIRERTRELAVLKTLGFSDPRILTMVLGESVLLALLGGIPGLAIAALIAVSLRASLSGIAPAFAVSPTIALQGVALMIALGLITGIIPALSAMRLKIATALGRG